MAIIKKCETCGIKYKDCFEYTNIKDNLIKYYTSVYVAI